MLKYGMPDLRDMFAADVRWLAHYGFSAFAAPNPATRPELRRRDHEVHPLLARRSTSTPTPSVAEVAEAMTMAGLEVEHVDDPGAEAGAPSRSPGSSRPCSTPTPTACASARSTPWTAARRSSAARPTRGPGLTTIYAPIGAYIPGTGITLEPRPVRGVVSNGMLCSAAELEIAEESDGILELPDEPGRRARPPPRRWAWRR